MYRVTVAGYEVRIGYFGNGRQFKKLQGFFHAAIPNATFLDLKSTNASRSAFKKFGADFFVIASPNSMHVEQIRLIRSFSKLPIFCEKPVYQIHECPAFLSSSDVYVNNNLRYSTLAAALKIFSEEHLASKSRIFIKVDVSYPIATDPAFGVSWRGSQHLMPLGVYENVAVHYFDLFWFIFGAPLRYTATLSRNVNGQPTTSFFVAENDFVSMHCYCSYEMTAKESIGVSSDYKGLLIENGIASETTGFNEKSISGLYLQPETVSPIPYLDNDGTQGSVSRFLELMNSNMIAVDLADKLRAMEVFYKPFSSSCAAMDKPL